MGVAAATNDDALYVWQVADGRLQYTWQKTEGSWQALLAGEVTSLAFSPAGDILAIGQSINGHYGTVQLWSLRDGALLQTIPLDETLQNEPQSLAFSSDGAFLAIATWGEVMVFEMAQLLP